MDVRWWVAAAALVVDVGALASVWISRSHGRRAKVVWTVVVLVLPLLGGIGWFGIGRERQDARRG